VHVVGRIDGHAHWRVELIVTGTIRTPLAHENAAGVEFLDTVIALIAYVDVAGRINGYTCRNEKLAIGAPRTAKLKLKNAAGVELLHPGGAVRVRIRHINVAG